MRDLEPQAREALKKLAVNSAHGFPPLVPFLVGHEATGVPERVHDGVEVVAILDADMFLDGLMRVARWLR